MKIEINTIGEVAIPDEKLYGINTDRAEQNFPSSSEYVNPNLIKAYLQEKLATANINYKISILPKEMELLTEEKLIYLISNQMGIQNE